MKIFLAMFLNRGKVLDMDENTKRRLETRASQEWSMLAKEPVTVEVISGHMYAFGSELATLRLFRKFHKSEGVDCGYSVNLGTHYFSLPQKFTL
jgi:hypothetical protein